MTYYCNKYNIQQDGPDNYVKKEQTKHNQNQFHYYSVRTKIGPKSQSGYQLSMS